MKRPPDKKPPRQTPKRQPDAGSSQKSFDLEKPASKKAKSKAQPRQQRTTPPSKAQRDTASTTAKRSRSDGTSSETSKVGFKKPPKSHSWKKGQSGNPKGRKKGSKNKKSIIISLMEGRLGRKILDPKKLTAQEALLWKAIQRGLAGDAKSMAFAFKRYDDATASSWTGQVITTEEDQQVYDALRAKIRREIEEDNNASK